jgi:Spy/CpxP family protein refolding chaperone
MYQQRRKDMKRLTVSMVATMVLGLAAYSLADAQAMRRGPGAGFGQGVQEGTVPGFQERGPRRGGPGRGFGMMALRGIELTEDQQAQIKAIHDAERAERQGPPADAQLRHQLQLELYADVPDAQKISDLQQQLLQAETARLAKHAEIQQKVAQVLTPEQRAQVRERLAAPRGRRQ